MHADARATLSTSSHCSGSADEAFAWDAKLRRSAGCGPDRFCGYVTAYKSAVQCRCTGFCKNQHRVCLGCSRSMRHDPAPRSRRWRWLPALLVVHIPHSSSPARLLSLHAHLHLPPRLFLPALKKAGVDAIVFDKDNCLTEPYADVLHPSLQANWAACKSEFGAANILVYSNWAGSADDADGAAAARLEGPWKKKPSPLPTTWICVRTVAGLLSRVLPHQCHREKVLDRVYADACSISLTSAFQFTSACKF